MNTILTLDIVSGEIDKPQLKNKEVLIDLLHNSSEDLCKEFLELIISNYGTMSIDGKFVLEYHSSTP